MERGPMALFGAIVAVGLGPAMWLGAQFGNVGDLPSRPPAVTSEHKPQQNNADGGTAGSVPEDPTVVLNTDPRANIQPLDDDAAQPRPAATRKSGSQGRPTPSPSADAASPSPTDDDAGDPPTQATEPPTGDGGGDTGSGGGDDDPAPSPPSDGGGDTTGTGGTGAGTGTGPQTPSL